MNKQCEKIGIKNALVEGRHVDLVIEDHRIAAILPRGESLSVDRTIDADGARLLPGLIDIHSHGCLGHDTMDGTHLSEMAADYLAHGVTTWYPTTMTQSQEKILAALASPVEEGGAHIPGFHLEGPYINVKYKGAQNEKYVRTPSAEEFALFSRVGIVTVAPELPGALDFIRTCGVPVALGHTDCDYETACAAFDAGASCLTHTCNAMPPLHHRAPGPIGAAVEKNAYAQVICDGLHIARGMIILLYRAFGPSRMILISDSMHATGLGDGVYDFGGQPVTVRAGVARTEEGALAGSTTRLFDCVHTAISFGIPPEDAFRMASTTPAEMMGLNKGKIAVGYDADLLLLDEDYRLLRSMIL